MKRAKKAKKGKKIKKAGKLKKVKKIKKVRKAKKVKKTKQTKKEKKREINLQLIDELIARGRKRGFVTDSEVLHYFPNVEDDISFLEEIYDQLEKANIKVLETNQLIELPKEEISREELERATRIDETLPDAV